LGEKQMRPAGFLLLRTGRASYNGLRDDTATS